MRRKFWYGVQVLGFSVAMIGLGSEAASALIPFGIACAGGLICYLGKVMEDRYVNEAN